MKKLILPIICLSVCITASAISIISFATSRSERKEQLGKQTVNIQTRVIPIGTFDEIDTESVHIKLTIGTSPETPTLTGNASAVNKVSITNDNGKLKVRYNCGKSTRNSDSFPVLSLSARSIKEIEAALAAKVTVSGNLVSDGKISLSTETAAEIMVENIKAGTLEIDAETASKATVRQATATEVKCNAETAACITIAGTCQYMSLSAETAGKIKALGMKAGSTKADAETGGSITCPQENISIHKETGGRVSAN